jgi:hypothetical protein
LKDSEGNLKYSHLAKLCFCVLSLPHGNADPERGFSLNKNILNVHGFSIKEDTLEAIRIVQDFIVRSNGVMNIPMTKDLFEHCKSSHTRYQCYLEEKRKNKEEEDSRKQTLLVEKAESQLDLEKYVLLKSMKVAEHCIDEGNAELENLTKAKTIDRAKLISSQTKISMGLKRKAELSAEMKVLEKKVKDIGKR